jgi:adenylate cyclase
MKENKKTNPIRIDLNQFKLHIDLKKRIELTLHFNSPSRRFYLSLIAFVVNEMKRLGKVTSIPLEGHHALLALLNESVGGSAGSSNEENLLPRIYRKWKDALPNLEEAPLFRVLGRTKKYDEGDGKAYSFTDPEKDNWANLFEYIGSNEKVRLKFAIDKIGLNLCDVDIVYEDSVNGDAWDRFLLSLKTEVEKTPETKPIQSVSEIHEPPVSLPIQQRTGLRSRYRWIALIAMVVMIVGAATWAIWEFTLKPALTKKASIDRMAFPLPDKPSLAVLAFTNMSGDLKDDLFGDGLAEGIINALSKSEHLFVIDRTSTFAYKGKPVTVKQVAEEMGVRYVIEGSVQREGERVRITVQLIDAVAGHHLFSERYDRDLKSIMDLQDEVAMKVLTAVRVKLTTGEGARISGKGTKNLDAFLKVLQASEQQTGTLNKERVQRSMQLAEEAIALDPEYAHAYSVLGAAHLALVAIGASESPGESLRRSLELGKKAVALDEFNATAHANLAFTYIYLRELNKAMEEAEKGVSLNPNSAHAYWALGSVLAYAGRSQEAFPILQKCLRLSPIPVHSQVLVFLASYYRNLGQYEEAIATYKKVFRLYGPDHSMAHLGLAGCYAMMGRENEARAEAAEVMRIDPKFSVEWFMKNFPVDQASKDRLTEALLKAGLK